MFEDLFNKKISTKNLYIATLKICVDKEFVMRGHWMADYNICHFRSLEHFILVRKIKKGYQDIFTKTIYERDPSLYNVNDFYINTLVPFPTTTSYITYKEAVNMYKKLNNVSFNQDNEKSFQKIKKH